MSAQVWTGATSTQWSTAANWTGGVPGNTATATFNSNTARDPNFTAAATVGRLLFNNGADAEIFTGSTLTIGGVAGTGINNQSGLTQTFNNTLIASANQTWTASSGNLTFSAVTLGANLTLTGSTTFTFGGTLLNSGGNRSFTNNSSGTVTVSGGVSLSNNNTGRTLTFAGSGNTTVSGVIANGGTGAGRVTKTGAGTLAVSGNNTYTGTTTLSAGTIAVASNTALGTGGIALNAGTLASTAGNTLGNTVTFGGNAAVQAITLSGTFTQSGGNRTLTMDNATLSGTVNLSNNNTARTLTTFVDSGTSTISGVIANGGTGAGNLTKTGAGTLVVSGTNTYTGDTTVSAGTLRLGASNVLANTTDVVVASGATFDVNGQTETIATLAGTGGTVLLGTGSSLTTAGNASTTFAGAFSGDGLFNKGGTGTLTLTSSFDFDGTFELAAGTLRLNGAGMVADIGTFRLMGNTTIDFASNATLRVGTLDLNGFTLSILNWIDASDYFFAANWTGAVFDTGGAAPMNQVTFSGANANDTKWLAYEDNPGSGYHQITPVPEPSTYGALLLGALTGLFAWRRLVRRSAR